jgi:hypothetical protein
LDRPPLLAPLLDPSMTRMADENKVRSPDICVAECAQCYRAYLPNASQRLQVNGLQRVRPNDVVKANSVAMASASPAKDAS